MTVCVFGSLNMDLVIHTDRLPLSGETLMGSNFQTAPGGKGANQAAAVARLEVATQMIGRVGNDDFGQRLLTRLRANRVQVQAIHIDAQHHTGIALITVSKQGENQIVVASGANGAIDRSDVDRLKPLLKTTKVLLLQLEIPLPEVIAAAKVAKHQGVVVILDPAPAPEIFPQELYKFVDILTPNQVEASQLVGFPVQTPEQGVQAAKVLHDRGIPNPIITLGDQGIVCVTAEATMIMPAIPVTGVDPTAAGDAFNGALAAALAQDFPLQEALRWGTGAGAIAVTKFGAQTSLGDRAALEHYLKRI